jgi:5'-nucleotidase
LKEFQQLALDFEWNADFETFIQDHPRGLGYLKVNFPKLKDKKGIKICRQAKARWIENLIKHTTRRLLLAGEFVNQDKGEDTDEWANG